MTRLEVTCHTQIAHAKKRRTLALITIAHIILSEILHVMHIHSHIVSKAMRHEQAGNSACDHFIDITTDKIESFELLEHISHCSAVYIPV